jgi:hypothetical protein
VLDVTLNIRYILWNVYVMLADRATSSHATVKIHLYMFFLKKKNGSSQSVWVCDFKKVRFKNNDFKMCDLKK